MIKACLDELNQLNKHAQVHPWIARDWSSLTNHGLFSWFSSSIQSMMFSFSKQIMVGLVRNI
ncbi:MAG: hypothetical protein CMF39_00565 [Legionellaceae bacterium]|nr:hypothetical protein [Legionellaceae bacterium]